MEQDTKRAAIPQELGQVPKQPEGVQASGVAQPKYVTLEEAQQLAQQAAEDAFRRAQGLVTKADNRLTKKVQADLQALKNMLDLQRSLGLEIDPAQESAMRQKVLEKAFESAEDQAELPQSPQAQQAPVTEEDDQDAVDPVTAEAWRMMEEAGVIIEDDDPEIQMLDSSSPYKFLQSIDKAIEAKRQRTASKAPTNLGGMGSYNPNPIEHINDPTELLRMGFEQRR